MPLFARRPSGLLLLLWILAAGMTPTSAQDSKSLQPVLLVINSVAPDLGDAPLWMVPHALGYFADEGLQVGVENAGGSSGALQVLAAGNRTYGSALVVPTTAGIKTIEQLRAHLNGSNPRALRRHQTTLTATPSAARPGGSRTR